MNRKCYSEYVEDKLLDMYSVSKNYVEKNEEKVIRINWFCRTYDVGIKTFKKVIDALCKNKIVFKDCRLVYEIEIEE